MFSRLCSVVALFAHNLFRDSFFFLTPCVVLLRIFFMAVSRPDNNWTAVRDRILPTSLHPGWRQFQRAAHLLATAHAQLALSINYLQSLFDCLGLLTCPLSTPRSRPSFGYWCSGVTDRSCRP